MNFSELAHAKFPPRGAMEKGGRKKPRPVENSRSRSKTAEACFGFFRPPFRIPEEVVEKSRGLPDRSHPDSEKSGQFRTCREMSQMAHRVLFLAMFRRTGRLSANFGSFRTRRKSRTFGKWRTCRAVISSGQFRTRRPAEFLTNTHCSSGETRNILLGVEVGYRWQVAFRLSSNRRTR